MSTKGVELAKPDSDSIADKEIFACMDPRSPKSFFLYAGAGSGKTRSLKEALFRFRDYYGEDFRRAGKKIAVITFTNAAASEISDRVGDDALFPISTIHSFCWTHIGNHHKDIQSWLLSYLPTVIEDLLEKQKKGRAGRASEDRERAISQIQNRLDWLRSPRRFTYNPSGDNFGVDSLSHSEVLKIAASFIQSKPSMQALLVNRFPFLLIDESQDTSKILIDAFLSLATANKGKLAIGLIGDTMQRIYPDGHQNLSECIPMDWARPVKRLNHRSPQRIVELGNALRAKVDDLKQFARDDSKIGFVRLFIAPSDTNDKPAFELKSRKRMADLCEDPEWLEESSVKILILEHHMAASRQGFLAMFQALDQDSGLSTGLRTGELAGLRFFSERVAPLISAASANKGFEVMDILRKNSPLLKQSISTASADTSDPLQSVRTAVTALNSLVQDNPQARFLDVLRLVASHRLFDIPTSLTPFIETDLQEDEDNESSMVQLSQENIDKDNEDWDDSSGSLQAWRTFLESAYCQILPYAEYINNRGRYGTHQGVKGLQFDRVQVILDDSESKGFLFSYEKLLGAKPLSEQDRKNLKQGTELGVDRTRRLLYVTCTRAMKSLSLVAYTNNAEEVIKQAIQNGWFTMNEIECI